MVFGEQTIATSFVQKIESEAANFKRSNSLPLDDRPLRIGYFGLLRDEWSWQVLESLAKTHSDKIEIVLAGLPLHPLENLPSFVEKHKNIQYIGQYKSPEDLPSLYKRVDMVWGCYPPFRTSDWNLRWARPNRFYQGCLFRKPFFTRLGCQDAIDVEKYDIGLIVGEKDVADTVKAISKVTSTDIKTWTKNISDLPRHVFAYTSEVEELAAAITKIAHTKK